MEFKFRAVDVDQGLTYIPPSSSKAFYPEDSLSAGVLRTDVQIPGAERNLLNTKDAIRREAEKSRIRQDLMIAEILRRRELEDQVIREVMMERKLLSNNDGFLLNSSCQNRFGIEERLSMMGSSQVGNGLQFLRPEAALSLLSELKPSSVLKETEVQADLVKPINSDSAVKKRKAETIAFSSVKETFLNSNTKKPEIEWKCNLCQVITTSEQGLNDHLQGKKHKAKEAKVASQGAGKNMSLNSLSKKSKSSTQQVVPIDAFNLITNPSRPDEILEFIKNENDEKKGIVETITIPSDNKVPSNFTSIKTHKEWRCDLCDVSATSEQGLNDHLQGKKHKAKEGKMASQRASKTTSLMSSTCNPIPPKSKSSTEQVVLSDTINIKLDSSFNEVFEDVKNENDGLQCQKFW